MAKKAMLKYEGTVAGAVNDAFNVIEELAGEMREAYDSTPESLQSSGVGEARGEAADTLEQISEPDVPGDIAEVAVTFEYLPPKRRASRADRLADGLQSAAHAIEALEALVEEKLPNDGDKIGELDADDVRAVIDEIQGMIDEAEGVSFPGMYG